MFSSVTPSCLNWCLTFQSYLLPLFPTPESLKFIIFHFPSPLSSDSSIYWSPLEAAEKLGKCKHCQRGFTCGLLRVDWLRRAGERQSLPHLPWHLAAKFQKHLPPREQHSSEKHLFPSGVHAGLPAWQFSLQTDAGADCDWNHYFTLFKCRLVVSEIDSRQEHNINTCTSDATPLSSARVTCAHAVLALAHTHLPLSTHSQFEKAG